MHPPRRQLGVTLIELLFTLALLALLAGLAVPGFRATMKASALRASGFELMAGLQQIRANSILEGRAGVLCPVDASGACLPAGGAGSAWRSFLEDGTARRDVGGQRLPPGLELRASRSPLRFWPGTRAASTGTLTICDRQGISEPRAIVLSQNGRARFATVALGTCRA
jgi:type IV fimbrial biogenesis protein FimT